MSDAIADLMSVLKTTGLGPMTRELKLRLTFLLFSRGVPAEKADEILHLARLNGELESCYRRLRKRDLSPEAEAECLDHIRMLEDTRFQALERMNGDDLDEYNTLPLKVV